MPARPALPGPAWRGRSPMGDVEEWLERLGLSRYRAVFAEHDIDREILPDLTDQDLEKLGLSLGHRKKLLRAIAELARPDSGAQREAEPALRAAERRQLTVMFCRSGRLDRAVGAARSRGHGRGDPRLSAMLRRGGRALGRPRRQVHGRWRAGLLRLAAGARGRGRAGGARGAGSWSRRCALELPGRLGGERGCSARAVGIATGLVMVGELIGEGAAREEAVVGETPNLAARLQALAAPGSVVISQATRRLVGGLFELADLGPRRLKGFAEPLAAWRVEGEGRAEGRFEARQGAGLTPLVGRERGARAAARAAGGRRGTARARWCCCPASPGSASRAWCASCGSGSRTSPTSACSTSARRTTRPARCIR